MNVKLAVSDIEIQLLKDRIATLEHQVSINKTKNVVYEQEIKRLQQENSRLHTQLVAAHNMLLKDQSQNNF